MACSRDPAIAAGGQHAWAEFIQSAELRGLTDYKDPITLVASMLVIRPPFRIVEVATIACERLIHQEFGPFELPVPLYELVFLTAKALTNEMYCRNEIGKELPRRIKTLWTFLEKTATEIEHVLKFRPSERAIDQITLSRYIRFGLFNTSALEDFRNKSPMVCEKLKQIQTTATEPVRCTLPVGWIPPTGVTTSHLFMQAFYALLSCPPKETTLRATFLYRPENWPKSFNFNESDAIQFIQIIERSEQNLDDQRIMIRFMSTFITGHLKGKIPQPEIRALLKIWNRSQTHSIPTYPLLLGHILIQVLPNDHDDLPQILKSLASSTSLRIQNFPQIGLAISEAIAHLPHGLVRTALPESPTLLQYLVYRNGAGPDSIPGDLIIRLLDQNHGFRLSPELAMQLLSDADSVGAQFRSDHVAQLIELAESKTPGVQETADQILTRNWGRWSHFISVDQFWNSVKNTDFPAGAQYIKDALSNPDGSIEWKTRLQKTILKKPTFSGPCGWHLLTDHRIHPIIDDRLIAEGIKFGFGDPSRFEATVSAIGELIESHPAHVNSAAVIIARRVINDPSLIQPNHETICQIFGSILPRIRTFDPFQIPYLLMACHLSGVPFPDTDPELVRVLSTASFDDPTLVLAQAELIAANEPENFRNVPAQSITMLKSLAISNTPNGRRARRVLTEITRHCPEVWPVLIDVASQIFRGRQPVTTAQIIRNIFSLPLPEPVRSQINAVLNGVKPDVKTAIIREGLQPGYAVSETVSAIFSAAVDPQYPIDRLLNDMTIETSNDTIAADRIPNVVWRRIESALLNSQTTEVVFAQALRWANIRPSAISSKGWSALKESLIPMLTPSEIIPSRVKIVFQYPFVSQILFPYPNQRYNPAHAVEYPGFPTVDLLK
ncbi:hypothetical protein EBR96_04130 [bacterium]|nr:hypothetical protein [bacterium]